MYSVFRIGRIYFIGLNMAGILLLTGCLLAMGCYDIRIQRTIPSSGALVDIEETSESTPVIGVDASPNVDIADAVDETGADGQTEPLDEDIAVDMDEEETSTEVDLNGPPPGGPFAYIPCVQSDSVTVIDTSVHQVVTEIPVGDGPRGVVIHPNGHRVYIGNNGSEGRGGSNGGHGSTVSVIDAHTNTELTRIGGLNGPEGLEIHPDGSRLYVTMPGPHTLPPDGIRKEVGVIDTELNELINTIEVGDQPWGLAITHDGSSLFVANSHSETISQIDTETETVIREVMVGDDGDPISGDDVHISMMKVDPNDSERLYVVLMHLDTIQVYNTASLRLIEEFYVWVHPHSLAFTPDGTKLFIPTVFFDLLWVVNVENEAIVEGSVPSLFESRGVSVTADSQWVYVANAEDSQVSVYSTQTNELVHSIGVGEYPYAFGSFIYWPRMN